MKQVEIIVAGAGGRGSGYAELISRLGDRARIVGVAEPRDYYRQRVADKHGLHQANVFTDWHEMAEREKFADAVIIATQDRDHAEPAVAFANKGYHMLLEKPMATNEPDCRRIVDAARANAIIFAVCHVMRYTTYTQRLKEIIDAGAIGQVVSIQHLEPVGYWHQAHSYVRGNWRNESMSSPMLLAKSCHDLDWIRYIIGGRCEAVSSFGALTHFLKSEKPEGAADRCLDCGREQECPYSAVKIYLGRVSQGHTEWPVDVLTSDVTEQGITTALRDGPYGKCVYECDNDVVDNQVVNMLFEGGRTATFTMTAFNASAHRKTRVFGTRGEIDGDGETIRIFDFMTDEWQVIDLTATDPSIVGGHGGGDEKLIRSFVDALEHNDPTKILSGPDTTLETHLMVFAAEQARRENRVVSICE